MQPNIFTIALHNGDSIDRLDKGNYAIKITKGKRGCLSYTPSKHSLVIKVARSFAQCLDELETLPQNGGGPSINAANYSKWLNEIDLILTEISKSKSALEQRRTYIRKNFGKTIEKIVSYLFFSTPLRKLDQLENRLQRGRLSILELYDHKCEALSVSEKQQILDIAGTWKIQKQSHLFDEEFVSAGDNYKLTQFEMKNLLTTVTQYPNFGKFILNNPSSSVVDDFFKCTIRDLINGSFFVLRPALCEMVKNKLLSQRIGCAEAEDDIEILHVSKPQAFEVSTTLKLALKQGITAVDLSDLNQKVTFSFTEEEDWTLTLGEILDYMGKKNEDIGPFEVVRFKDGEYAIHLWDCHHHGKRKAVRDPVTGRISWKYGLPINLNTPKWWENLPCQILNSIQEVREIYNKQAKPGEWVLVACATITNMKVKHEDAGTHGYLQVVIPLDDVSYMVVDLGKYAKHFPEGDKELLSFFANTVEAAIEIPDTNKKYRFRLHTYGGGWILNDQEGNILMDVIRSLILASRAGKLPFQIQGDGCANFAEVDVIGEFEKRSGRQLRQLGKNNNPNLFRTRSAKVKTQVFPLKQLQSLILLFPKPLQVPLRRTLTIPFNPFRGINIGGKKITVWNNELNQGGRLCFPPKMYFWQTKKGYYRLNGQKQQRYILNSK